MPRKAPTPGFERYEPEGERSKSSVGRAVSLSEASTKRFYRAEEHARWGYEKHSSQAGKTRGRDQAAI